MVLLVEELDTVDHDETIGMDSTINSAFAEREQCFTAKFLFDQIRAISSETKRINETIESNNRPR